MKRYSLCVSSKYVSATYEAIRTCGDVYSYEAIPKQRCTANNEAMYVCLATYEAKTTHNTKPYRTSRNTSDDTRHNTRHKTQAIYRAMDASNKAKTQDHKTQSHKTQAIRRNKAKPYRAMKRNTRHKTIANKDTMHTPKQSGTHISQPMKPMNSGTTLANTQHVVFIPTSLGDRTQHVVVCRRFTKP